VEHLRDTDPQGGARAVQGTSLPTSTAANRNLERSTYLHRSCLPLAVVDLGEREVSGGDFIDACPFPGCGVGCYVTAADPNGRALLLDDPDVAPPFDPGIQGTVDQGVTWRWDGQGNPTDRNGNGLTKLLAWYDTAERAAEFPGEAPRT
jgi:hypothetical protein